MYRLYIVLFCFRLSNSSCSIHLGFACGFCIVSAVVQFSSWVGFERLSPMLAFFFLVHCSCCLRFFGGRFLGVLVVLCHYYYCCSLISGLSLMSSSVSYVLMHISVLYYCLLDLICIWAYLVLIDFSMFCWFCIAF